AGHRRVHGARVLEPRQLQRVLRAARRPGAVGLPAARPDARAGPGRSRPRLFPGMLHAPRPPSGGCVSQFRRSLTGAGRATVTAMRITLTSILVDDQERALRFYTEILGFRKKQDFPAGEYRWITVVSPEGPDGVALSLEPNANPAAKTYQKALFEQGIPLTSFESRDLVAEAKRLKEAGVVFTKEPTRHGPVLLAMFNDTCGNLIQMHQSV